MLKIGIVIPTRGDRPGFIENTRRLISNQTIQPTQVLEVNFKPTSNDTDITKRYRQGYDFFRKKEIDVIAFMEDDDWYAPNYLETMVDEWIKHGKPDLFGTNRTIYYNIMISKYYTMFHDSRSSAMSTLIKPYMNFNWCKDTEPYTDSHLWFMAKHDAANLKLSTYTFKPKELINLGIKHGIGKTGGQCHITQLHRYDGATGKNDESLEFLRSTVDEESFNFYQSIKNKYHAQKR